MPTRTAFVLTIGDVIESGPPTVTPSNRRNASAPNSPSSGSQPPPFGPTGGQGSAQGHGSLAGGKGSAVVRSHKLKIECY